LPHLRKTTQVRKDGWWSGRPAKRADSDPTRKMGARLKRFNANDSNERMEAKKNMQTRGAGSMWKIGTR
jgi:hypothetical protein